jgi:hypothetical protein
LLHASRTQLPGTVLRQRNTPAAGPSTSRPADTTHIGAHHDPDDVPDEVGICEPAQRIAGEHGVQIAARDVPIGWQTDFLVGTTDSSPSSRTIGGGNRCAITKRS